MNNWITAIALIFIVFACYSFGQNAEPSQTMYVWTFSMDTSSRYSELEETWADAFETHLKNSCSEVKLLDRSNIGTLFSNYKSEKTATSIKDLGEHQRTFFQEQKKASGIIFGKFYGINAPDQDAITLSINVDYFNSQFAAKRRISFSRTAINNIQARDSLCKILVDSLCQDLMPCQSKLHHCQNMLDLNQNEKKIDIEIIKSFLKGQQLSSFEARELLQSNPQLYKVSDSLVKIAPAYLYDKEALKKSFDSYMETTRQEKEKIISLSKSLIPTVAILDSKSLIGQRIVGYLQIGGILSAVCMYGLAASDYSKARISADSYNQSDRDRYFESYGKHLFYGSVATISVLTISIAQSSDLYQKIKRVFIEIK